MKKIATLLFVYLGVQAAQAGILIEPYLGYEVGAIKATLSTAYSTALSLPDGTELAGKTEGTVLGARIGYTLPVLFWVALEPTMMTGKYKASNTLTLDCDSSRTQLFIDAGVDFPILLRAWVGYGMTNEWSAKDVSGTAKYTGSATKVGVGFTGLPFVSINLEYITHNFNKVTGLAGTVSDKVSDNFSSTTSASTVLSVSLPLDL